MSRLEWLRIWPMRRAKWLCRAALLGACFWACDALIWHVTQMLWCQSLGFGALWRARFGASCALFAFGLTVGALLWWPLWNVSPSNSAREKLARLRQNNPDSVLIRWLHWAVRHGAWWLRAIGALVVVGQSAKMASWGDWAWLARAAVFENLSVQSVGVLEPFWNALHFSLWTMVCWASGLGVVWIAATAGFDAVENVTQSAQGKRLRRAGWIWLGLWFGLLGARYGLLNGQSASEWRGWEAWVPGGWNWLGWHWQRPCRWLGVTLCVMSMTWCVGMRRNVGRFEKSRLETSRVAVLVGICWFAPGIVTLVGSGVLWRAVVSPDQTRREKPFLDEFVGRTFAAWGLDRVESQRVQVEVLARRLDGAQRARLVRQTRLWDEESLRGALPQRSGIAASLNRRNGRLVIAGEDGVYDASRAVNGRPPRLSASTWSGAKGEIALEFWWQRALWAWRWRDSGVWWEPSNRVAWRGTLGESARALFPLALIVDESYFAPDGTRLQNVLLSPQRAGAARWDLGNQLETQSVAGARDVAVMSVARDGRTAFHRNRDAEPLLDWWQKAFGDFVAAADDASAKSARAARRFPLRLMEAMAHLSIWERDGMLGTTKIESEYAVLEVPEGGSAFGLQSIASDEGGRARAMWWADGEGAYYGRVREFRFENAPVRAVLPQPRETSKEDAPAQSEVKTGKIATFTVKRLAVRGKVLMVPLWQRAQTGKPRRVALGLVQSEGLSPENTLSAGRGETGGYEWNRVAVTSALSEGSRGVLESIVIGQNAPGVWKAWQQPQNQNARDLAQTALQLHDAAQREANQNSPVARELRGRERRVIEALGQAAED